MRIDRHDQGAMLVLRPRASRIDADQVEEFKSILARSGVSSNRSVLLDLSDVDFIDSSGLGAVVWALKTSRRSGGRIELCGLRSAVRQVFKLTRMDRVFRIHDDVDQATLAPAGA